MEGESFMQERSRILLITSIVLLSGACSLLGMSCFGHTGGLVFLHLHSWQLQVS